MSAVAGSLVIDTADTSARSTIVIPMVDDGRTIAEIRQIELYIPATISQFNLTCEGNVHAILGLYMADLFPVEYTENSPDLTDGRLIDVFDISIITNECAS